MLTAVQGGHQAALMAPTEVLAEQHFLGVRALLDGFTVPDNTEADNLFAGSEVDRPLQVQLLTNRTTAAERRRLLADLETGALDSSIGTHALSRRALSSARSASSSSTSSIGSESNNAPRCEKKSRARRCPMSW